MIAHLSDIQDFLRRSSIDAWLVLDFRGSNAVLGRLLGGPLRFTTRRLGLVIPASGEPRLIVHGIDHGQVRDLGIETTIYLTWQDWHRALKESLGGVQRVAMEYSPMNELPVVATADAGSVELVRSLGVSEVVSSADLIQIAIARWSSQALRTHEKTSRTVDAIKDGAFALIRSSLRDGGAIDEAVVQRFILDEFARNKLNPGDPPIVAVNAHGGDPHFEVDPKNPAPVRRGDWVLIDLWARPAGEREQEEIYSDITWVGVAAREPTPEQKKVFEAVRSARDAAVEAVKNAFAQKKPIRGCDVDDAAMTQLRGAGFGEFIRHRTGHSLSPGPKVHGLGVNIDNLETHDTRLVMPGVGFTVEPGLYLPGFGVRLEINVYMDQARGPVITSGVQREVIALA